MYMCNNCRIGEVVQQVDHGPSVIYPLATCSKTLRTSALRCAKMNWTEHVYGIDRIVFNFWMSSQTLQNSKISRKTRGFAKCGRGWSFSLPLRLHGWILLTILPKSRSFNNALKTKPFTYIPFERSNCYSSGCACSSQTNEMSASYIAAEERSPHRKPSDVAAGEKKSAHIATVSTAHCLHMHKRTFSLRRSFIKPFVGCRIRSAWKAESIWKLTC